MPMLRTGVTSGMLSTAMLAPAVAMFEAGKGAADAVVENTAAPSRPAHAAAVSVGRDFNTACLTRS